MRHAACLALCILYMYINIYTRRRRHKQTDTHTHTHTHTHTYIYTHIYIYVYIRISLSLSLSIHVLHVYICIRMHFCVSLRPSTSSVLYLSMRVSLRFSPSFFVSLRLSLVSVVHCFFVSRATTCSHACWASRWCTHAVSFTKFPISRLMLTRY